MAPLSSHTIGMVVAGAASTYVLLRWLRPQRKSVGEKDCIVVTGADSGIGYASVLELNKRGFKVYAGVIDSSAGQQLKAAATFPERVVPVQLDVTNDSQVEKVARQVAQEVGEHGLQGLFNNAGVGHAGHIGTRGTSIEVLGMEHWHAIFEVNVFGLVRCTKAFLALLRKGKGTLLLNASISGRFAVPFMGPYSASKHAVCGLADAMRREWRGTGVPVSLLECGPVGTGLWGKVAEAAPTDSPNPNEMPFLKSIASALGRLGLIQEATSQVAAAFTSVDPRPRYLVNANALNIIASLPLSWQDALVYLDWFRAEAMVSDADVWPLFQRKYLTPLAAAGVDAAV